MTRFAVPLSLLAAIALLTPATARGGQPPAKPAGPLDVRVRTGGRAVEIVDGEKPVLLYNYLVVDEPAGLSERISEGNRKYAVPRCDYIHPLYGPHGEILTDDWVLDHPHHRGIYWAWPEVDWHGKRGDLHALQHVFARPVDKLELTHGSDFAQISAQSEWRWEDGTPIVREHATIRVVRGRGPGHCVDLAFRFTAMGDDVQVARRETTHYGGLDLRLSPAAGQQIETFTDPAGATPRRAWAQRSGIPRGGSSTVGLTIFQSPSNPEYPGDWVQFPEISWIQPTFPTAGKQYTIGKDRPLNLRFRLWIHEGKLGPEELKRLWDDYARE